MRASRLLAALVAAVLAASSVGATVYTPKPAAKDCCKKRCGHDAPTLRSCCCTLPAVPPANGSAPEAKMVSVALVPSPSALIVCDTPAPAATWSAHAPPGCPLFLQRCALVL